LLERNESYYWETEQEYNVNCMNVNESELAEIDKYMKKRRIN
jgi:hypothetical protein